MPSDATRRAVVVDLPPGDYEIRMATEDALWSLSYVDRPSAVDSSYSKGGVLSTRQDSIEVNLECPLPSAPRNDAAEPKSNDVVRMNGTRSESSKEDFVLVQDWTEDGQPFFSLCRRGVSVRNIRGVRTDEAVVPKPQKRRRLQKKRSSRKKAKAKSANAFWEPALACTPVPLAGLAVAASSPSASAAGFLKSLPRMSSSRPGEACTYGVSALSAALSIATASRRLSALFGGLIRALLGLDWKTKVTASVTGNPSADGEIARDRERGQWCGKVVSIGVHALSRIERDSGVTVPATRAFRLTYPGNSARSKAMVAARVKPLSVAISGMFQYENGAFVLWDTCTAPPSAQQGEQVKAKKNKTKETKKAEIHSKGPTLING
eukprot:scaffold7066_cov253-Pinguiococcus_pyrenoidosus.AAC.40